MSIVSAYFNQVRLFIRFTSFFLPPFVKTIHLIVMKFVFYSLATGMLLATTANLTTPDTWSNAILKIHITISIITVTAGIILIVSAIKHKSFKHFFPYLWGEYTQLFQDIKSTLKLKIIPPKPYGLAETIQGLGLGALFLVIMTGISTTISKYYNLPAQEFFQKLHEVGAILVGIYYLGHGGMALIHFTVWKNEVQHKNHDTTK